MKPNLFVVHLGTQHAYRFANAAYLSGNFRTVHLFTGFLIRRNHPLSAYSYFRKRVKPVHPSIRIHNFLLLEIILFIHKKLQSHDNDPNYIWQIIFNISLLPLVFTWRKGLMMGLFETTGWPAGLYGRKWGIPILMNFPSVSHEMADLRCVPETRLGKWLKVRERSQVDYALFCSLLAKNSYAKLTSSKKDFVIYPAAVCPKMPAAPVPSEHLNLAFIANTEYRKGLDILLRAYGNLNYPKKLWLIGKISKRWVEQFCFDNEIDMSSIHVTSPVLHYNVREMLIQKNIHLHVLPSRFDAFGMVVPETMALAIPNIISSYVGAGEMLQHKKNVLIMDDLSPESLLGMIHYYIGLHPLRKALLHQNARIQANNMTWVHYNSQVKAALDEIMVSMI